MIELGGERLKCIRFRKWNFEIGEYCGNTCAPIQFCRALSVSFSHFHFLLCLHPSHLMREWIAFQVQTKFRAKFLSFSSKHRKYQLITVHIVLELRLLFLINARHCTAHHHRHYHYHFHRNRHRSGISHVRSVLNDDTTLFIHVGSSHVQNFHF